MKNDITYKTKVCFLTDIYIFIDKIPFYQTSYQKNKIQGNNLLQNICDGIFIVILLNMCFLYILFHYLR